MVYSVLPGMVSVVFLNATNNTRPRKVREMSGPTLKEPTFVRGKGKRQGKGKRRSV